MGFGVRQVQVRNLALCQQPSSFPSVLLPAPPGVSAVHL